MNFGQRKLVLAKAMELLTQRESKSKSISKSTISIRQLNFKRLSIMQIAAFLLFVLFVLVLDMLEKNALFGLSF